MTFLLFLTFQLYNFIVISGPIGGFVLFFGLINFCLFLNLRIQRRRVLLVLHHVRVEVRVKILGLERRQK
jgi:hypothetical protein